MDRPEAACPHLHPDCPVLQEMHHLQQRCRRLESLSRIDELTGYYNYRHLLVALEAEMDRTRRSGVSTAVAIADLDHFKAINDTHGHDIGNCVLETVSRTWQACIRRTDIPCRYGGEEFLFILPNTRLIHAGQTAERLRLAIEALSWDIGPDHVSSSFGVSAWDGAKPMAPLDLIRAADRQLLLAKANGRNRVSVDTDRVSKDRTELTPQERRHLVEKQ